MVHGNILRRKAGIKMEELNKLIEDLESQAIEVLSHDKDGNLTKTKLY